MPSAMQPVNIPDELRPDVPLKKDTPQQDVIRGVDPAFIRDAIALVMIVSGAVMVGFGVGAWLCPAAGVTVAGAYVGLIGFALAFLGARETE